MRMRLPALPGLSLLRTGWTALLLVVFSVTLRAHDTELSVVDVQASADALELTATFSLLDVQRMLPRSVQLDSNYSPGTVAAAQTELNQLAAELWDVRAEGRVLSPGAIKIGFTPSETLGFHLTYPRPATGVVVFRAVNLAKLPASHRELFRVYDEQGRKRIDLTLTTQENTARVSLAEIAANPTATPATPPTEKSRSPGQTFGEFFKLGVEHIWTGYDHLLFLLGLLLVCRSFRSVITLITCFTLSHSITLGLAALDVVSAPASLVEPLIAASIVFVGVENLWRHGAESRSRAWLTFGFGLIHGFGFASVLRDLGVGSHGGGIAVPLVAFNLGVEAGQVCVAAGVLPLLAWLFRSESIRRRGVRAASAVIAVAGLYWVIDRTLLS